MSNYTQTTSFTPKDTLPSGNPAKVIKGADFDVEFGAIATAISSKADTSAIPDVTSMVSGPASVTDNTLPRFDGTTGKLIQGSGVVVDDSNRVSGGSYTAQNALATVATDGASADWTLFESVNHGRFIAGRSGGNYANWSAWVAGASGVTRRFQITYDGIARWFAADGTTERMTLDSSGNLSFQSTGSTISNVASINGGQLAGLRNKIINGGMRVDQRNSGAAVTYPGSVSAGSEMYALDRWLANSTGSPRFSMQRSTEAPPGFTNSLLITTTTAGTPASGDFCYFAQSIEGHNVADLAFGGTSAKPVAIGFWVRSSLTGTFGGSVANAAGNRRYSFSFTIAAANTWEYKTISLAGDTSGTWVTDTGIGLKLVIDLGSGTTNKGTAGAWGALAASGVAPTGSTNLVATAGATMHITGVQLEAGAVATPFEHRPYGMELALCQRYLPAINCGSGVPIGLGQVVATNVVYCPVVFQAQPRVPPTGVTVSGASHLAAATATYSALTATSSISFLNATTQVATINLGFASSPFVAGNAAIVTGNNASAQILFTGCEL